MEQWSGASSNVSYTRWLMDSVWDEHRDDAEGSAGVREPRRPIRPLNTTGAALDVPREELEWAIERGRVLAAKYGW